MLLAEGGLPFSIEPPRGKETCVVVEVPHAGVAIDAQSMAFIVAPVRGIGRDADLFVDRIFADAPDHGATLLVAHLSRMVVDLNRGPHDFDGLAVEGARSDNLPRGLIWRITTEGDPVIHRPLPEAELERRMRDYYEPYHRALASIIDGKVRKFGQAIVVCGHSMPSQGRRGHVDVGTGRADIVPGTRGKTSASPAVIATVEAACKRARYSVKHDDPYKGGFSTGHYGVPADNVHAIQIEIARRLYMEESLLTTVHPGFESVVAFAGDVVRSLGGLPRK